MLAFRSIFFLSLLISICSTADALHKVKPLAKEVGIKGNEKVAQSTVHQIPRGGASKKKTVVALKTTTEGASIPSHVFNLVKGIVGVGVLSLPAGIAAFGDAPGAVIPATCLIALIGILSGFGFFLIGKVCAYTGATSYRDAWAKSVGESSSWIPAVSCTTMTCFACLAFSMVLGDTFSALLGTSRNPTLLALTSVILLPLCLLKNLSALAPFSLAGVLGMGYTAIAMAVRYFDGSYQMPDGTLVADVAETLQPVFGSNANVFSSKSLILICMLSTAYMAHFNAPKFYLELKDNTLARYNTVVSLSFGISILLISGIAMLGFLTFGQTCSGLVLNNYSNKDLWMSGSRIAVAVSLVFS
jgi:amino acid permease